MPLTRPFSDTLAELRESPEFVKAERDESNVQQCNCMGPQDGDPMCPCSMRTVRKYLFEMHKDTLIALSRV